MCAICVVVIVVVCAGLSVPNKCDIQYKKMFALSIAVDNFLKQIGHTKNVSEPATAYFGKNQLQLAPLWDLTHKAQDLKNLKNRLQILPIKCFVGSDRLFPTKYEKLLQSLAEYAAFHSEVTRCTSTYMEM